MRQTEQETLSSKVLHFRFNIEGMPYEGSFRGEAAFAAEDPGLKLALAIGQASTFEQTDEYYAQFLQTIVNKGLPPKKRLQPEAIDELAHTLIDQGYAQNGGPRYRLTAESEPFLKGKKPVDVSSQESLPAEEAEYQEPSIIRPLGLPIKSNGQLNKSQHTKNKSKIDEICYRSLETLAELELAPNHTIASKNLGEAIQERTNADVNSIWYTRTIGKMAKQGLIEIDRVKQTMSLTAKGESFLALLKAYPDILKVEPIKKSEKKSFGTSLEIIEHLMEQVGFSIEPSKTKPDDLPDYTDWFSTVNLDDYLADVLNSKPKTMARRTYDMRTVQGLIEVVTEPEGYTKVRVLKHGLELDLKTRKHIVAKEQLLDEAEVEEAQDYIEGCINLAEALGDERLAKGIKSRHQQKSLFELTQEELAGERAMYEELYEQLRRDVVPSENRALAA